RVPRLEGDEHADVRAVVRELGERRVVEAHRIPRDLRYRGVRDLAPKELGDCPLPPSSDADAITTGEPSTIRATIGRIAGGFDNAQIARPGQRRPGPVVASFNGHQASPHSRQPATLSQRRWK